MIDADKAYEVLTALYHHKTEAQHTALKEALNMVPIAEPVKTGKWKAAVSWGEIVRECSECGSVYSMDTLRKGHFNYCPNCGSRMEGTE